MTQVADKLFKKETKKKERCWNSQMLSVAKQRSHGRCCHSDPASQTGFALPNAGLQLLLQDDGLLNASRKQATAEFVC